MDRVRRQYATLDEDGRLDRPSGQLEFLRAMELIDAFVPIEHHVLDLDGGTGRYTMALAHRGNDVVLTDRSGDQLMIARDRLNAAGLQASELRQADPRDLGAFADDTFDTIVAFGPFQHLAEASDRAATVAEIRRVLRPSGHLLAAVVPRLSGARAVIERVAQSRQRGGPVPLPRLLPTGVFATDDPATQPPAGWFPSPSEVHDLFTEAGFTEHAFVSLRGLAAGQERALLDLRFHRPDLFDAAMIALRTTAAESAVIDVGGLAVWVGDAS